MAAFLLSGSDTLARVSYLKHTWQHSPAGTPVVTASDPSGTTVYILLKNLLVDLHGPTPALVPAKPAHAPHGTMFLEIPKIFESVLGAVIKSAVGSLSKDLFQDLKLNLGFDVGGPPTLAEVRP